MRSKRHVELVTVLIILAGWAYLLAPFTLGDTVLLAPKNRQLDAIQQTLLIADGIEKLPTSPGTYYDTAILYPDRNQLRTTEPFLGYVILGLPLRAIFHLNDVEIFETIRWAVVVLSLVYAFRLFRSTGCAASMSAAGAVLCLSQPGFADGIERLQILALPLMLAVLYHGTMWWSARSWPHGLGLFLSALFVPLCGMINATMALMATLFVVPLLVRLAVQQRRRGRLAESLVPLILAAVCAGIALGPWLLDRSDLAVYTEPAFLQTKHWNVMRLPLRLVQIPGFVAVRIGFGAVAALAFASVIAAASRRADDTALATSAPAIPGYLTTVTAAVLALAVGSRLGGSVHWLQQGFQVACYAALLMFWRDQLRASIAGGPNDVRQLVLLLTGGLGTFLCLMSFGPVYVSNADNLFAVHILTLVLEVVPPLNAIRDFERIWMPGLLLLSVYLTIRLSLALREHVALTRATALVVGIVATISALSNREALAGADVVAPSELAELASHSRSTGALYVHPDMTWHSSSGVWMIAAASQLRRPIVNGYLGIEPPWFAYAGGVLHRFPDPEAMWLLHRWNVQTVASVAGEVRRDEPQSLTKVFQNGYGVLYEMPAGADLPPHPSEGGCLVDAPDRIDAKGSALTRVEGGVASIVIVPRAFLVKAVEVSLRQSIIERVPSAIDVYAFDETRGSRLNEDRSGEWIESLAADALVRRQAPVATIRVSNQSSRALELVFKATETPPLDRLTLCGRWMERR